MKRPNTPGRNATARILLGVLFIVAGLNHFWRPAMYRAIMPDYLPQPARLVEWSGYAEIALGALTLLPGAQRLAGYGLIALLIAIFPANLHMALHPDRYPQIPPSLLWARLPLQGVLIAWARWSTAPPRQP